MGLDFGERKEMPACEMKGTTSNEMTETKCALLETRAGTALHAARRPWLPHWALRKKIGRVGSAIAVNETEVTSRVRGCDEIVHRCKRR